MFNKQLLSRNVQTVLYEVKFGCCFISKTKQKSVMSGGSHRCVAQGHYTVGGVSTPKHLASVSCYLLIRYSWRLLCQTIIHIR